MGERKNRLILANSLGALALVGLTAVIVRCENAEAVKPQPVRVASNKPEGPQSPLPVTSTAILLPTFDRTSRTPLNVSPTQSIAERTAVVRALSLSPNTTPSPDRGATQSANQIQQAIGTLESISTITGSTPNPTR